MYHKPNEILIALILIIVFFSCQQPQLPSNKNKSIPIQQQLDTSSYELDSSQKSEEPIAITYEMANAKQWLFQHKTESLQQAIAFAVNRTDRSNFSRMDSVIIPSNLNFDIINYLPFPSKVNYLKDINKIIFFSYPTQTFAAYEKGVLVYSGPTNMGKEKYLTPTGLFFTNWKAKVSTSTVNEKWILNWNFNVLNKEGIGWHQYSLPGYPVSHSCLRLQKKDAKYLYYWADQWVLANKYKILIKGTPVIIFGNYDFNSPKPWLQLPSNPHSLDISEEEIQKITQPFLNEILSAQKTKETIQNQ